MSRLLEIYDDLKDSLSVVVKIDNNQVHKVIIRDLIRKREFCIERKDMEVIEHFDLDNYKDWLVQKLIASNVALNDLVFQVKQYASGDIGTMDYFRDELKVAEKAFVSLG
jgi:hypothetical protein